MKALKNDLVEQEIKWVEKNFNLSSILALKEDIQIIRGEDYQYMCYINKEVYATGITPMYALAYGVLKFKEK